MTAVDLCCGAGGLSQGLLDGGVNVVLGVDSWASALKVYERNLKLTTPSRLGKTSKIVSG
jgi:DNA (cytosine-5)-methyltransferase 1